MTCLYNVGDIVNINHNSKCFGVITKISPYIFITKYEIKSNNPKKKL